MKMTTRFLTLSAVLIALFGLVSCKETTPPEDHLSDAVESMIGIRIAANDYDGAMSVLANCDDDLFDDAAYNEQVNRIIDSAKTYVSERVDEIIQENGYKEAYDYLEYSLPKVLDGDSLSEEKQRIHSLMLEDVFETAQAAADEGNYVDAIEILSGIGDSRVDDRVEQLLSTYKSKYALSAIALDDSDTLTDSESAEMLKTAYSYTGDEEILSRIRRYSRPLNLEALNAIKHRFSLVYDEKTDAYTMKNKFFDTFVKNAAQSEGSMLGAAISEHKGNVTFFLVLAYSTDELLETEQLIFTCDGISYSFAVEDRHREEKVINLDYDLEICGIFDSPTSERHTLSRLMEALSQTENVSVSAKGVNRDMDFQIPAGQLNELRVMWQAYLSLRENPELFDEVFVEQ